MGRVMRQRPRGDAVCAALGFGADVLDVDGLDCAYGDLVDIEGHAGVAVALLADRTLVAPIDQVERPVRRRVVPRGPLVVRGDQLARGRLIDCLGRPLRHLNREPVLPSFAPPVPMFPPAPLKLVPGRASRWTLGPIVHDLREWLGAGASVLAVGEPAWLVHDIAHHQAREGRTCVVARVGVPTPGPWVSVGIAPGAPWAARWLVPHAAMAIAHAVRTRGEHAVVIVRDFERWLALGGDAGRLTTQAYRSGGSISLLAHGRTVGRLADAFDCVIRLGPIARGEYDRKFVNPPVRVPHRSALSAAIRRRPLVLAPGDAVDTIAQLLAALADKPVSAIAGAWLADIRARGRITDEDIERARHP